MSDDSVNSANGITLLAGTTLFATYLCTFSFSFGRVEDLSTDQRGLNTYSLVSQLQSRVLDNKKVD